MDGQNFKDSELAMEYVKRKLPLQFEDVAKPNETLFVRNLAADVTEEDLQELFGEESSVRLPETRAGCPRG